MKESAVHLLLASLIEWHIKTSDSGFPPVSILHRIAHEGFASRPARAGHNILCGDMSADLRRIQAALNSLDYELKLVAVVKHSPMPINDKGEPKYKGWGDREKSIYLGQKLTTFKSRYRKALRHMSRSPVWRRNS